MKYLLKYCVESPLCLHEAGREVYLKQDKKKKEWKDTDRVGTNREFLKRKAKYFCVEIPPSLQEAGSEVVFS